MKPLTTVKTCTSCLINPASFSRNYCESCWVLLNMLQGRDLNREKVRIRKNHTCESCGSKWTAECRRFHIHHLGGLCGMRSRKYDNMNELDNLQVLCPQCHMDVHENKSARKNTMKGHVLDIAEMIKTGMTLDKIGEKFDVKSASVSRFMKNHLKYDENTLEPMEV